MNEKFQEIFTDLKSFLEYLKKIGITGLPISESGFKEVSQSKFQTLEEIRRELGDCKRCKLHRTRRTLVFGEGHKKAKLMIIGEGPGYEEDVQGKPFVGRAGQLLTKILQSCYPFLLKQIHALQPQIICALGTFSAQTLLKTENKITALRGRFYEFTPLESPAIHGRDDINKTSRRVESTTIPIAESSLRHRKGEGKAPSFLTGFAGIKVIPTYHPAYLLRNPERKREVWEDMKKISKWMVDHHAMS